jgi:hypothetical protein
VAWRWFCSPVRGKTVFSCTISFTSTVERTEQAMRGDRYFAAGYGTFPASLVMAGPPSCHGERGRGGFISPFLVLPLPAPLVSLFLKP